MCHAGNYTALFHYEIPLIFKKISCILIRIYNINYMNNLELPGKPYWETRPDTQLVEPYLLEFLPQRKYSKILDVGCGDGRSTIPLTKIAETVYGIDSSKKQIEYLKSKHIKNIIAEVGDINHLPFEHNFFDLVISLSVVEHIPRNELAQVFSEVKRVLKPNGIFMVRNDAWFYHILEQLRIRPGMIGLKPDPTHITMMRGNEFAKRLTDAGFVIIHEDHFPFYRYEKKWGIKFPKWFARIFATHSNIIAEPLR